MDRLPPYVPRSLTRLALWLAVGNLVIAAAIVAATWLALQAGRESDLTRARETTENLAASLSIEIGAELKQVDNALQTLALQYRRTGGGPEALKRAMERALADQRSLLPQVDAIRMTDAHGQVIYGLAAEESSVSVGDRDYFQRARDSDGVVISEPLFGRVLRKWGIVVARRLEAGDGSFAGVVYTTLSTEHFIEGFKGLTIGAEGAISLRTRSQRLIARYSAAEPHSIRGVGDVIVSEDLMRKMAANPQQGWYMTKTRLDNIERITCYRQVRGYPLTIFTGASTADFLAAWRGEVLQQGALAAVVILTVLGCSVLVFLQQRRDRRAATGLQQLALEQALMLDNDMVGMMRLRGRNVVWQNRALSSLFGYAPGELLGQPTRQLYLDEASFREVGEAAYPAIESGRRYRQQLRMRRKDGTPVWIDLSGASVSGNESLWMMIDVSALKESEATARHLAVHDALTGLPNRVRFTERLAGALTLLGERVGLVAVCWVDLDGFKELNDQFGHEAGDVVLRVVAQRLQAGVRNHDLVARMGGDEFALLLTALRAEHEAEPALRRMLASIAEPIRLPDGDHAAITASIGIAFAPLHGRQAEALMRLAETAMTMAKRAGKRRVVSASSMPGNAMNAPNSPATSVGPDAPTPVDAIDTPSSPAPEPGTDSAAPAGQRPRDPGPPAVPDHSFDESVAGEEDPGATLDGEDSSRVPPRRS
ncbi:MULTISPECIES: diguanylate cyclase [unclassified Roseateles]|uniref:diguanylate cyclase domain-containing protein n=1 Tax=unclassified Roseateles TaxID=2626991 RepID=UPI0016131502|nr:MULTISPECIES: diguanylate cyclase [unclassified Roseateles]MBB3293508.1 diguanylate cyclase (GGDEF)-like protein/PAS domain S-box-containing protein [Mitsuaria sp. BK041]MBB3362725.1 diguanylate cyclase (GGDEF)-like protein/PAS domain S-box-containing protein [Mitsuaria sp. BK045]